MLILGDMSRDTKSIVSVSQSTEQAFSISYAGDHTCAAMELELEHNAHVKRKLL